MIVKKKEIDIKISSLQSESKKLSKGTGIELINNEELTSGKLLNLQTSSKLAHNPVAIDASSMTNGEVIPKIYFIYLGCILGIAIIGYFIQIMLKDVVSMGIIFVNFIC